MDTGATGYAFVDKRYARDHNLPLYKLKKNRVIEVIDGRPIESGTITHLARMTMEINGHLEEVPMFVTQLGHYPVVLGLPWLRRHDVSISVAGNSLGCYSALCLSHCRPRALSNQGS